MIDKTHILEVVQERLARLPEGHCLELRTYKRNRAVIIVKRADDLLVIEEGYEKERFETEPRKLKKLLKVLLKREFPRSHKIRLYEPGPIDETDRLAERKRI